MQIFTTLILLFILISESNGQKKLLFEKEMYDTAGSTKQLIAGTGSRALGPTGYEGIPKAEITNGLITAQLYLPDVNTGYYRATRFDWSGIITRLEYRGHTYYGKWFDRYEPTIHDAVMGPVEEFGPVGYDEAEASGKFLKTGVGVLLKPDSTPYNNFRLYKILNPGEWKIKKNPDQIQFTHTLKDTEYAYEYIKNVRLIKGKPQMVLEHMIKNTGSRTIKTTVYNHHFFMIDNQPTGPDYVITFPFELSGKGMGVGEIAVFDGRQIRFLREMANSERIYCGSVDGFSDQISDHHFTVDNLAAGAGVRVTCDRPMTKMVFWCSPATICPEPYIDVGIEPGHSYTWTITFEYYVMNQGPYTVYTIDKGVYRIEDATKSRPAGVKVDEDGELVGMNNCSSMYLVVGKKKALLIDLSNFLEYDTTAIESLRTIVKERVGNKEFFVTVTHRHGDHLGMLPAFKNDPEASFWIPEAEFEGLDIFPEERTTYFPKSSALDLGGGYMITTTEVPGHTEHGTLFFLQGKNLVFSGDALGSGSGVWLFDYDSFISYTKSIDDLIRYLEVPAHEIDLDKLVIYGGHYWQHGPLEKLTVQYIYDMKALIEKLKLGTAESLPAASRMRYLDTNFKYGTATITWNKEDAVKFADSFRSE